MRKILYAIMFCITTTLYAQPAAMSVVANSQMRTLSFLVRWVERERVDSTVISIFSSADSTTPIYRERGISPDTIRIAVPDDTLTYSFRLHSYRGTRESDPATAIFYFNADIYYRLVGIIVKPDSVTLAPGATQQFCAFIKFNDSTVAIRDKDKTTPECMTFYSQFPDSIKVSTGARQRKANTVCLQWQATGGTIDQEVCP